MKKPVVVAIARTEGGAHWLGTFRDHSAAIDFLGTMLVLTVEVIGALVLFGESEFSHRKFGKARLALVETASVKLGGGDQCPDCGLPTFETLPANS